MDKKLKDLIANGKTKRAIEELMNFAQNIEDKDLLVNTVMLSSRFIAYSQNRHNQTVNREELEITLANINRSILEISNSLPEKVVSKENHKIAGKKENQKIKTIEDVKFTLQDRRSRLKQKLVNILGVVGILYLILGSIELFSNSFLSLRVTTKGAIPGANILGEIEHSETIHLYLFRQTYLVDDLCGGSPLAEVSIEPYMMYSLANVFSFGIWKPIRVKYTCHDDLDYDSLIE